MAGKRAHGEGYITQTPGGKWRGQLMDGNDPITGKRIIRSFTAPEYSAPNRPAKRRK